MEPWQKLFQTLTDAELKNLLFEERISYAVDARGTRVPQTQTVGRKVALFELEKLRLKIQQRKEEFYAEVLRLRPDLLG